MIETLLYINSKGIAHRDIKLENMLVNSDYVLKFADFGFASFSKDETAQRGTPIYIAPEIILSLPYDPEKTDVFSTGVVLFAMSTGKFPFDWGHFTDKRYRLLIEKKYETFWSVMSKKGYDFSDSFKSLI